MNPHEIKFTIGSIWVLVGFVFTMVFASMIVEKEKKSGIRIYDGDNKDFLTYFPLQMSCFILGLLSFLAIMALKKRLEKIPDLPSRCRVGSAFSRYEIIGDRGLFE